LVTFAGKLAYLNGLTDSTSQDFSTKTHLQYFNPKLFVVIIVRQAMANQIVINIIPFS